MPVECDFRVSTTTTFLLARGSAASEIQRRLHSCQSEGAPLLRFHDGHVRASQWSATSEILRRLRIRLPDGPPLQRFHNGYVPASQREHRFRDSTTAATYLPSIVASEIPLHLRICHPVRATFQKFTTITYLLARGSTDSEIPRQLRIGNPEKATFQRSHDVYVSSTQWDRRFKESGRRIYVSSI